MKLSGQVDWDMNHQVSRHTVEGQLSKVLANLTSLASPETLVEIEATGALK